MKRIKTMNDFILGIMMLAFSLFLLFSDKIVTNMPVVTMGGYFARADVYIHLLATILGIVALVLIGKSINFKKDAEVTGFSFLINNTILISAAILILYTLLLPVIGFIISTFLAIFFLCALYTVKEENKTLKEYRGKALGKMLLRSGIYSVVLVVVLKIIFTYGLSVQLP